jgi:simple sugar transport system substrate-binding protein
MRRINARSHTLTHLRMNDDPPKNTPLSSRRIVLTIRPLVAPPLRHSVVAVPRPAADTAESVQERPERTRSMIATFLKQALVTLVAAGVCASANPALAAKQPERRLRFIFITTCVEEAFFRPVEHGMRDAATMLNVDCTFTGTKGVDIKAQAAMVRQAVKDGYDGIALNIIDPVAFDGVVQEAITAGVPVVAFNVDDQATPNARLSAVCQQVYEAGKTLAQTCTAVIPEKSHILMTLHAAGVSSLNDRLHGAQEILTSKGITWTVVITGNTSAEAERVITATLTKHPEIKFVLCTGQADTEGAGLAIEKHFAGKGLSAAGFDLSPETLRLVAAGYIRWTVDQQPYIQGFYPVVQLTQYRRYGIRPANIDAGASLIGKEQAKRVSELSQQGYR